MWQGEKGTLGAVGGGLLTSKNASRACSSAVLVAFSAEALEAADCWGPAGISGLGPVFTESEDIFVRRSSEFWFWGCGRVVCSDWMAVCLK